jgi:hypothetical protein
MKAVGTVWKNKAGYWNARLETGHPDESLKFEATAQKRMKDAMFLCNHAADVLDWEVSEWRK